MLRKSQKIQILSSVTALLLLATLVACKGFFVNPTLQSIAITPSTTTLAPGGTKQLIATGTFDDGSTSNVTSKSDWSSDHEEFATVGANTGFVTAASTIASPPGVATITAADGTFSNTATVTVCPAVSTLVVTPSTTTPTAGATITFLVNATFSGSSTVVNVTNSVTWNISNTNVIPSISDGSATVSSSATTGDSTTVSATVCGSTSQPPVTITVQ